MSPAIARHLLNRVASHPPADNATIPRKPGKLTVRETAILTRLAQGFSVTETAEHLHISVHTATTHIRNIYTKLNVTNRVQALNQARRSGLIH